jgi:hypothetical protein
MTLIFTIEQCDELSSTNPREFEVTSTFLANHGRYSLGDQENEEAGKHGSYIDDFKAHLKNKDLTLDDIIYEPVFMYEHSNIALSINPFGCSWDSGQLGYIYEEKENIRSEFNKKRISTNLNRLIEVRLEKEIEEYDNYINGEVYSIKVTEEDSGEQIDEVNPIYGDCNLKSMIQFLKNHYESIGNFVEIKEEED